MQVAVLLWATWFTTRADGLSLEHSCQFCSGSRQDFRKAGEIETLDEFRYEEWMKPIPSQASFRYT